MYEIVVCPYSGDSHVHDYRPTSIAEYVSVARELARDFPHSVVLVYQVLNGTRLLADRFGMEGFSHA